MKKSMKMKSKNKQKQKQKQNVNVKVNIDQSKRTVNRRPYGSSSNKGYPQIMGTPAPVINLTVPTYSHQPSPSAQPIYNMTPVSNASNILGAAVNHSTMLHSNIHKEPSVHSHLTHSSLDLFSPQSSVVLSDSISDIGIQDESESNVSSVLFYNQLRERAEKLRNKIHEKYNPPLPMDISEPDINPIIKNVKVNKKEPQPLPNYIETVPNLDSIVNQINRDSRKLDNVLSSTNNEYKNLLSKQNELYEENGRQKYNEIMERKQMMNANREGMWLRTLNKQEDKKIDNEVSDLMISMKNKIAGGKDISEYSYNELVNIYKNKFKKPTNKSWTKSYLYNELDKNGLV